MDQATIKDVARESGYSIATVSRVLSNSDYPVNARTRKAILECVDALGYVPNIFARGLKTNRSKEIAVVTPTFRNPFYTTIIAEIENTLSQSGYSMVVYQHKRNVDDPKELVDSFISKKIAGVVIASDSIGVALANGLRSMKNRNIPVMVYDADLEGYQDLRGVFFDYRRGGRIAAQELYKNGHKNVALITLEYSNQLTRRSFVGGFCGYYREIGHPLREDQDIFQSFANDDFLAGVQLAEAVLDCPKEYTAIAANNDSVAAGAISTMLQRGIRVPEEISIIGMDDNVYARMTTPLLTTVRVPSAEMGKLVAKHLLEEIEGNPLQFSIYLQSGVVERRTVQSIKKSVKNGGTGMHLYVQNSKEELGREAAKFIATKINDAVAEKGEARIVLSTGASQFETLSALVNEDVDWSKVTMFHLDEYVNLPITHIASFRKYLMERFVSIVHPKAAFFVNGEGDVIANIAELTTALREKPIDVGVIGIGENAHIAFNDPPADFDTREAYIVVNLNERCKQQQVGEGWFATVDDVPKQAISMTTYQIMQCKCIVAPVPGKRKAQAIYDTLSADKPDPMIPATLLNMHGNCHLYTDVDSASLCGKELLDQYR